MKGWDAEYSILYQFYSVVPVVQSVYGFIGSVWGQLFHKFLLFNLSTLIIYWYGFFNGFFNGFYNEFASSIASAAI